MMMDVWMMDRCCVVFELLCLFLDDVDVVSPAETLSQTTSYWTSMVTSVWLTLGRVCA